MKKIVWQPIITGIFSAILVVVTGLAGLQYTSPAGWIIGIYPTIYAMTAAIWGPLAITLAFTLTRVTSALVLGAARPPASFWANVILGSGLYALMAYLYRLAYERVKFPKRLFFWAGIVSLFYILVVPLRSASNTIYDYIYGYEVVTRAEWLTSIVSSYQAILPNFVADLFFTSLIWGALPKTFHRPLWYEKKSKNQPVSKEA